MHVIEAQRFFVLAPDDHLHIRQKRMLAGSGRRS
jgi:hypothetical protein